MTLASNRIHWTQFRLFLVFCSLMETFGLTATLSFCLLLQLTISSRIIPKFAIFLGSHEAMNPVPLTQILIILHEIDETIPNSNGK